MNKYPWLPIWVKKVIWFCFYKSRGHKWLLPGPTSTSHPFGWINHDCTNNVDTCLCEECSEQRYQCEIGEAELRAENAWLETAENYIYPDGADGIWK